MSRGKRGKSKRASAKSKYACFEVGDLPLLTISQLKTVGSNHGMTKFATDKPTLLLQVDAVLSKKKKVLMKERNKRINPLKKLSGRQLLNMASNANQHEFSISTFTWVDEQKISAKTMIGICEDSKNQNRLIESGSFTFDDDWNIKIFIQGVSDGSIPINNVPTNSNVFNPLPPYQNNNTNTNNNQQNKSPEEDIPQEQAPDKPEEELTQFGNDNQYNHGHRGGRGGFHGGGGGHRGRGGGYRGRCGYTGRGGGYRGRGGGYRGRGGYDRGGRYGGGYRGGGYGRGGYRGDGYRGYSEEYRGGYDGEYGDGAYTGGYGDGGYRGGGYGGRYDGYGGHGGYGRGGSFGRGCSFNRGCGHGGKGAHGGYYTKDQLEAKKKIFDSELMNILLCEPSHEYNQTQIIKMRWAKQKMNGPFRKSDFQPIIDRNDKGAGCPTAAIKRLKPAIIRLGWLAVSNAPQKSATLKPIETKGGTDDAKDQNDDDKDIEEPSSPNDDDKDIEEPSSPNDNKKCEKQESQTMINVKMARGGYQRKWIIRLNPNEVHEKQTEEQRLGTLDVIKEFDLKVMKYIDIHWGKEEVNKAGLLGLLDNEKFGDENENDENENDDSNYVDYVNDGWDAF